jgi:hypothetical protein
MKTWKQIANQQTPRRALVFGVACLTLLFTLESQGFPVSQVTFRTDTPFKGVNQTTPAALTSSDGLLTVAGWADASATTPAKLFQWWWIFGVNSGTGNGAYVDGQECMTLQFHPTVGCSMIRFLDTPAGHITISGFLSDPGAYAITHLSPLISNISYANGVVGFDHAGDTGSNYGQLLFANPAASVGQTLRVSASAGAGLYSVDCAEGYGETQVNPPNMQYNLTNTYTTPDGALTVRSFADLTAQTPANFGTYLDQCFGTYGGTNNGGIDGNETVTLQFAPGYGLSRLGSVFSTYSQVSIYGFTSDPGFSDPANGSYNATYSDGLLTFYPKDGGHYTYFFSNRAASAGQTLRINADPTSAANYFAIAGVGYADLHTLFGTDFPNYSSTYTTTDGALTITAYADSAFTPGTFNETVNNGLDWLGIYGGISDQAIDGTEMLSMQFTNTMGLSGLGFRYTGGTIILSGFTSDPGLVVPGGIPIGGTYSNGTLTVTVSGAWHPSQSLVYFNNPAASAGQTLTLSTDGSSGAQIALTQIKYAAPGIKLSIASLGNNQVVLTWPSGTLLQSTNVTGTYNPVSGATSPYTNAASGGQMFYRVQVQ